jgi:DNA-binding MarR family transcriptional regulator
VSQTEYQALAALRYALRRFLRFSEEAAVAGGLRPQQHQALLAIKGFGKDAITIGELAERLQLRHHSAVGLVNRLVAQRLVRRQRSRADRRQVQLHLTAAGEAVLGRLTAAHKRELRRVGPEIKALLERLRAN